MITLLYLKYSTFQIETILSKLLGDEFKGVYPLERLPNFLPSGSYVVNSHSSNLPGEHWLAIRVTPEIIRIFDPLGMYYPPLVQKLELMRQPVEYNNVQYQDPLTFYCGHYCISWLVNQM